MTRNANLLPSNLSPAKLEVLTLPNRGWRLFPVSSRGKKPLIKAWPDQASNDPDQIRAWSREHPDCNWGLACGPASGVFVLDVDGDAGAAAVREMSRKHSDDWLDTLTVITARGRHHYYRWPEGTSIRSSAGKLAAGLDIRADGGYVLVPPSIHPSGQVYQCLDPSVPIADAPPWLLELIIVAADQQKPPTTVTVLQIIPEGRRNTELTSLAGVMRRAGMMPEAIRAALIVHNANHCVPPLPEHEVHTIAESIGRYEAPENHERKHTITCFDHIPDVWTLESQRRKPAIEGIGIDIGTVTNLVAESGIGKSFLSLKIAVSVARGDSFLGQKTAKMKVLYMDAENPLGLVQRRLKAIAGGSVPGLKIWGNWNTPEPPAKFGDSRLLEIARDEKPLMIFDSLIRFHNKDENSASEMSEVMGYCRQLATAGATVLVVHHCGKNGAYRGASDILAGCDQQYLLTREKKGGKETNVLLLATEKHREQEKRIIKIYADFETGTIEEREASAESAAQRLSEAQRPSDPVHFLYDAVSRNPGSSTNQIIEKTRLRREQAIAILKEGEGRLWFTAQGPRRSRLYYPMTGSDHGVPEPSDSSHRNQSGTSSAPLAVPVPGQGLTGSDIDSDLSGTILDGSSLSSVLPPPYRGREQVELLLAGAKTM